MIELCKMCHVFMLDKYLNVMCGYRKFRQRGSNSDKFFLVDEGRKDPTTNKI